MKKILCYLMVLFISLWAFNGCKKMDSTYKQYKVPGGKIYTGIVNSPLVYAGRNRVKIAWLRSADPKIIKTKIFWNYFTDSVEVNIPPTGDTISVIIDNLPEESYSFVIRNYDVKGISSIAVEILGGSYGERYQSQLLNRFVNSSFIDATGHFSIQWGTADISTGAVATEVKYTNTAGVIQIKRFKIMTDTVESKISDYMPGTTFQYRTLYCPKEFSIDTFYTNFEENKYFNIKKSVWRVIGFSTQFDATTNAAANLIDGNDATRWYTTAASRYPHYVTIDMGSLRAITQFGIWRSTYQAIGDDQAPDKIQFLVSTNNTTWTDLGVFDFNRLIDGEQLFKISSHPTARYFKLVAVSGPITYVKLGEISAYEL